MIKYKHLHESWIEKYKSGMSCRAIASDDGIRHETVWTFLKRRGLGHKHSLKVRFDSVGTTANGDCLEWRGCIASSGYGVIGYNNKTLKAHRVSYELNNGEIPDGAVIRHKCDNPKCVNPDHLEVGSHAQNIEDRDDRGRTAKGETAGRAKITNEQAIEIREKREDGSTYLEISKNYPISDQAVRLICLNKTFIF